MWNIDRRGFLLGGLAGLAGLTAGRKFLQPPREIPGQILGASSTAGHRLRDGRSWPKPSRESKIGLAIVGAGVSGLSAAWRLKRSGFDDFTVFDLESDAGGNARGGRNSISAYPWGAHYLPVPNRESIWVREFLEEQGLVTGHDSAGRPEYDEFHLCHEPAERLHIHGRWQQGIVPNFGATPEDNRQIKEFFTTVETLRLAKGADGRPAFAIPIRLSSRDPKFTRLDRITMSAYLNENRWNSPYLNWYVNYCCRDDYGTTALETSAWAGLHYFAGRRGWSSNEGHDRLLTWPEGNAWLINRMKGGFTDRIRTNMMAVRIQQSEDSVTADFLNLATDEVERIQAKSLIWAGPRFVASHIIEGAPRAESFTYAPWMVANISLNQIPHGVAESWDNVFYNSNSLGYVVATHQNISPYPNQTVLTYYLPLSHKNPADARREAMERTHREWSALVLKDLRRLEIESHVDRLDVWLWGHGMIRPTPGFIWSAEKSENLGRVLFAHSDMSGISIFEEAQDQGIRAAQRAGRLIGIGTT